MSIKEKDRYKVSFKPIIWGLTIYANSKKEAEKLAWKDFNKWAKKKDKRVDINNIKKL